MTTLLNNFNIDFAWQFSLILVAVWLINIFFKKEVNKETSESQLLREENKKLITAIEQKNDSEKFSLLAHNKDLLDKYKKGEILKVYGITFFTLSGNFRIDIDVTKEDAEKIRDAFQYELFIAFSDGKERFIPSAELMDEYPDCPCVNLSHVVTFLSCENPF